MRIVLATPLYPPDTAEPAPYIKELGKRLTGSHDVTLVTYGTLPECVPSMRITLVDKRAPLLVRLFRFTVALWRSTDYKTLVYAENGSSVELPLALILLIKKPRIILHIGDPRAHAHAGRSTVRQYIERFVRSRAQAVVEESPLERPEILPFAPFPSQAFTDYEQSWVQHLDTLQKLFTIHA